MNSQSTTVTPVSAYQYRKTPSIFKKYANFTSSADKHSSIPRFTKTNSSDTNDSLSSSIPKCRPFSKVTSCEPSETNNTRYGVRQFNNQDSKFVSRAQPKEKSPEIVIQVTRATSPVPARTASFVRKRNEDDVIISETFRKRNSITANSSTQTEDCDKSSSRVAVLTTKFANSSGSFNKFPSRIGGYNYTRPTDLPIRSPSATRTFPSPEKLEPESALSTSSNPSEKSALRISSPLAALNKSLTSLKIETTVDSDTENESSYEEDYPMTIEKEPCTPFTPSNQCAITSEFSDKPPRYPLSPNLKPKNVFHCNDSRFLNIRGPGGLDSSSDDLPEASYHEKNIPYFFHDNAEDDISNNQCKSDESDSRNRKLYPIRKMDSGELPWWQNSNSDQSDRQEKCGYIIRKMDSADVPWWNKDSSESGKSEHRTTEQSDRSRSESEGISCVINSKNLDDGYADKNQGYVIRKMDSFDIPWWYKSNDSKSSRSGEERDNIPSDALNDEDKVNFQIRKMDSNEILWQYNSEESNSSKEQKQADEQSGYVIRKFDSGERDWWAEDECSRTDTPDWCNSKDDTHEYVETYKSNKSFRITKIEPVQYENNSQVSKPNECLLGKIELRDKSRSLENGFSENSSSKDSLSNEMECVPISENNNYRRQYINELESLLLYIGKYTNIDELLGSEVPPPAAPRTPSDDSSDNDIGKERRCTLIDILKIIS